VTPEDLLFADTHAWVRVETDSSGAKIATVGISAHAVQLLTDLVFLELPDVHGGSRKLSTGKRENGAGVVDAADHVEKLLPELGDGIKAGEVIAHVESVKAVSDVYSPVDGQIVEVNGDLPEQLERLSDDPYGDGWLLKIKISDEAGLAELLDHAAYQKQCEQEPDA